MKRYVASLAVVLASVGFLASAQPADARWGGVRIGIGVGVGYYPAYPRYYYYPSYYYPPTYYYPPQTVYYVQPPVYYTQPPTYVQQQPVYVPAPAAQPAPAPTYVDPTAPAPAAPTYVIPSGLAAQPAPAAQPAAQPPPTQPFPLAVPPPATQPAIEAPAPPPAPAAVVAQPAPLAGVEPKAKALIELLSRGDDGDRKSAAKELRKYQSGPVVDALVDALEHDGFADVRKEAADSLGQMGAADAQPALRRVAREDTDPAVRKAALKSARMLEAAMGIGQ